MGIVPSWWSVGGGVIIVVATSVMAVHRQARHGVACRSRSESEDDESDNGETLGPATKIKEND